MQWGWPKSTCSQSVQQEGLTQSAAGAAPAGSMMGVSSLPKKTFRRSDAVAAHCAAVMDARRVAAGLPAHRPHIIIIQPRLLTRP